MKRTPRSVWLRAASAAALLTVLVLSVGCSSPPKDDYHQRRTPHYDPYPGPIHDPYGAYGRYGGYGRYGRYGRY